MHIRVLDLDDSIPRQTTLMDRYLPETVDMRSWGPRLRLGCRWGTFDRFADKLAEALDFRDANDPVVTLYGSGDFHHVSLALLRQQSQPINLLVLDNHPDWMRRVPILHCGTWLYHAARLPQVKKIFHVGGNVDFDNAYRWLAPWPLLEKGKIVVFPSIRRFPRGSWKHLAHEPVRSHPAAPANPKRLARLVQTYLPELRRYPLYISLDKDVMLQREAPGNWDSGHLTLEEVQNILEAFLQASGHRLAGMDILGDWSPVKTQGIMRLFLHWSEHPNLKVDLAEAVRRNEITNLSLLETLFSRMDTPTVARDRSFMPAT